MARLTATLNMKSPIEMISRDSTKITTPVPLPSVLAINPTSSQSQTCLNDPPHLDLGTNKITPGPVPSRRTFC